MHDVTLDIDKEFNLAPNSSSVRIPLRGNTQLMAVARLKEEGFVTEYIKQVPGPLYPARIDIRADRDKIKRLATALGEEYKRRHSLTAPSGITGDPQRVFIGHGRSLLWRELKDFLADRLRLPWDEFNRETPAGLATSERMQQMLSDATFAFLVMTAEDEHSDGSRHARENVIHEVGLFQGKLGFTRAIILLEEGCTEFSNITGLGQIRFAKGRISSAFEEIRLVLEREGMIPKGS